MSAVCPYCGVEVTQGSSAPRFCTSCGTAHHEECWQENGGCTVFGCASAPSDEPKVNVVVGPGDAGSAAAAQPVAQLYNPPAQSAYVPPATYNPPAQQAYNPPVQQAYGVPAWQAPPPAPQGYAQSQPQPYQQPYSGYAPQPPAYVQPYNPVPVNPYVGYNPQPQYPMYAYARPPRNRMAFILLGIFLGCFGIHNFYAGYTGKAIAQLLITLFSVFILSFVTAIWAIIEVCVVDRDSDNVPMV
jgi:TM2 domain-containing membrane protein YozV